MTPFTLSIFENHVPITKMLLGRPDLELRGDEEIPYKRRIDPLLMAAEKGQVELLRELVRFGCDVDRKQDESYAAKPLIPVTLMKCGDKNKVMEIVDILLAAGCKPNLDNVRLASLKVPEV